jgi:hypothetical protein
VRRNRCEVAGGGQIDQVSDLFSDLFSDQVSDQISDQVSGLFCDQVSDQVSDKMWAHSVTSLKLEMFLLMSWIDQ